ncbi:MAG: hypothetical protein ACMG6E_05855 [Candidatus Roizmanbacteria bacterium]
MLITLSFPETATLLVKEGDQLAYGKAFYTLAEVEHHVINISSDLSIKPADIFGYLTVLIGTVVKKGTVLAKKKGLVGSKKVTSPVDGTVLNIEHQTGTLIIEAQSGQTQPISSFCQGIVKQISPENHTVSVEIQAQKEFNGKLISGQAGGTVYPQQEEIIADSLVIIKDLDSTTIAKCEALGANGFVCLTYADKPSIPFFQIIDENSFTSLSTCTYKYGIFSQYDKKLVLYL